MTYTIENERMKLIQKAFLYKLEAEIHNGKLIYTQKRLLSKISKECNLYDFDDEIYESVYKDWRIGIIATILFLLAGFIIITIYVNSNTIDNFLFYFIPAVIEKVKKANIMSLCCGIWNLPFGIPVTLFAIFKNIHSLKYLNMDIPTKALKKYVLKTVK